MAGGRCRVCEPDTYRIDGFRPLSCVSIQLNNSYDLLSPPVSGGEAGDEPAPLTDNPWSLAQLGEESFELCLRQAGKRLEDILLLELGSFNCWSLGLGKGNPHPYQVSCLVHSLNAIG